MIFALFADFRHCHDAIFFFFSPLFSFFIFVAAAFHAAFDFSLFSLMRLRFFAHAAFRAVAIFYAALRRATLFAAAAAMVLILMLIFCRLIFAIDATPIFCCRHAAFRYA